MVAGNHATCDIQDYGEPWSTQRPTIAFIYDNDIDLRVVHLIEIQRIVGPRPTRNYGLESIANRSGTDSNARSSLLIDSTYPCMDCVIRGWRQLAFSAFIPDAPVQSCKGGPFRLKVTTELYLR